MTAVRSSSGRPSLATVLTADVLGGLTLTLIAGSVVFGALASDLSFSGASTLAIAITFLGTGYLIARRQPANPVGWLLLVTGLSAGFSTAAGLYAFLDYRTYGGTLPLGPAVLFCDNATWPVSLLVGMAFSASSIGGSTGHATTPTAPSRPVPPACKALPTSTSSATTCSASSATHSNEPTPPCGSGDGRSQAPKAAAECGSR